MWWETKSSTPINHKNISVPELKSTDVKRKTMLVRLNFGVSQMIFYDLLKSSQDRWQYVQNIWNVDVTSGSDVILTIYKLTFWWLLAYWPSRSYTDGYSFYHLTDLIS